MRKHFQHLRNLLGSFALKYFLLEGTGRRKRERWWFFFFCHVRVDIFLVLQALRRRQACPLFPFLSWPGFVCCLRLPSSFVPFSCGFSHYPSEIVSCGALPFSLSFSRGCCFRLLPKQTKTRSLQFLLFFFSFVCVSFLSASRE